MYVVNIFRVAIGAQINHEFSKYMIQTGAWSEYMWESGR